MPRRGILENVLTNVKDIRQRFNSLFKDELSNYVEGLSLSDFMGYIKFLIWFYYNDYIILCQALSIILYNHFNNDYIMFHVKQFNKLMRIR